MKVIIAGSREGVTHDDVNRAVGKSGFDHPDWGRFVAWIATLPHFDSLIWPEGNA